MTTIKIENKNTVLQVNLNGGSYVDFHFKDLPINPLDWQTKDPAQPSFMGHFLCFDRWGPPSNAEKINGFHHHGEVNTESWKLLSGPFVEKGCNQCTMKCTLPMAGLELTRKIELSEEEPVFYVTEDIKNLNKNGRIFNIVQHVTIAPPFLDPSTLIDNNTEKGFENKMDGSLTQEEPVLTWPEFERDGEKVNLRQFLGNWPEVSSFVYSQNEEYGWVTAINPGKKLMLGYLWKIKDYPWINFWRSGVVGTPMALGMEFGTTGLHEPFSVLVKKGKIFDRNIFEYIDANEVIQKSFVAFLAKIPDDYEGVEKIEVNGTVFTIMEKNIISRDIVYHFKKQAL